MPRIPDIHALTMKTCEKCSKEYECKDIWKWRAFICYSDGSKSIVSKYWCDDCCKSARPSSICECRFCNNHCISTATIVVRNKLEVPACWDCAFESNRVSLAGFLVKDGEMYRPTRDKSSGYMIQVIESTFAPRSKLPNCFFCGHTAGEIMTLKNDPVERWACLVCAYDRESHARQLGYVVKPPSMSNELDAISDYARTESTKT